MTLKRIRAIVIAGNGTNCEMEMAHACRLGGADDVEIVHIYKLLHGEKSLADYHFLNLAGGFLDGDDLGAAKANAVRLRYAKTLKGESIFEQILTFIAAGKIILGVCNGFQLMVKLGLVPSLNGDHHSQDVTLTFNDSGKFEDRWVYLKVNENSPCIFTRGIRSLYLPVRHGEGKFIPRDTATLAAMKARNLIVAQYSDASCAGAVMNYPDNPNGSMDAVAGICDATGRIFGMMPHPEAFLHFTNHPRWTRESLPEEGMGVAIFRNAVRFLRENF